MSEFSIGSFFEALFKYGKDYGFTLWHFMGLAILGIILWVGSKVAAGAGKAVQGAQNVYIKMIEDLQKKADADRADQEARVNSLREQLTATRKELDDASDQLVVATREATTLRRQLALLSPAHDGATDEPAKPSQP